MAKTKVELQNYQGESLSPITIASNVLYEDGRNAQEVFEEYSNETFTPTIENSSSMFKVGQGDSVDYSGNIVNGAYESMVLKGKSMVNCIQEPSSQDVILPYEFEDGQYVTINDTKESGALGVELKGQTLVNIHGSATYSLSRQNGEWFDNLVSETNRVSFETIDTSIDGWKYLNLGKVNLDMLKPNTKYLVYFEIADFPNNLHVRFMNGNATNKISDEVSISKGNNKAILTTTNEITKSEQVLYVTFSNVLGKVDIGNAMIFEYVEGMENWDIPYFEGMTSCKMPILHTVGSLFDAQKIIPNNAFTYSHSTNIGRFEFTNRGDVVANTDIQLPAGTYDISFLIRGACDNGMVAITFAKNGEAWHACRRIDINYNKFGSTTFKEVKSQRTFDAPVTVTIVGHAWTGGATGSGWCEFKDIRFTPVGKTSILSLPEEVVLRSLPNGVCDTYNTKTGVYTQRIGEYVLDGSQSVSRFEEKSGASCCNSRFTVSGFATTNSPLNTDIYCDKFSTGSVSEEAVRETIKVYNQGGYVEIRLSILKSKLSSVNASGVVQYLQSNPTAIQYELATPIVTKINLPSTLKSWNTTTHIYSEIPENSLYPILSHSNPTYPVILKPSTKYSIVANSYSNNHTNSPINFNLGGATTSTTVGSRVTTITTPSTLTSEELVMGGRGNKLNNVMVIEGDVVGDEPYFEGICDCKSPILSNVGKNLFDVNGEWHKSTYSHAVPMFANGSQTITTLENGVQITTNNNQYHGGFGQFINIGGINKLRIAFTGEYTDTKTHPEIVVQLLRKGEELPKTMNNTLANTDYNPRKTSFKLSRSGETASKVISTQGYECAYVHLCGGYLASMSGTYTFVAKNICIEDADQVDIYEPYKSNTTTFEQKDGKTIVLRSLPNGVCDTLNVETGEYVQRIGELVADGDNTVSYTAISTGAEKTVRVAIVHSSIKIVSNESVICAYCNNLGYKYNYQDDKDFESFFVANSNNRIFMRLAKSKLETLDIAGVKKYFSKNPYIFQYELATPIVSTIDVQGFPYAYENGHVQLSSGHNAQSLTPKVEYSVATNRNGQIRTNQKMVERHQKQLDQLQAIILANMVNTQYQQTLTTLNYDLLKKEVGE